MAVEATQWCDFRILLYPFLIIAAEGSGTREKSDD